MGLWFLPVLDSRSSLALRRMSAALSSMHRSCPPIRLATHRLVRGIRALDELCLRCKVRAWHGSHPHHRWAISICQCTELCLFTLPQCMCTALQLCGRKASTCLG